MSYKKGNKVIIDDKKIIKEYEDGIRDEKDPKTRASLQKELKKFQKYMKEQKKSKKSHVIKGWMWESPETMGIYYLVGHWYMKEDNIIGLEK